MGDYFGGFILAKKKQEALGRLIGSDAGLRRSRTNVCVPVREFLPLEVVQESFRGHFFYFSARQNATQLLSHAPIDSLELSGVPRSARSCLAAVLV